MGASYLTACVCILLFSPAVQCIALKVTRQDDALEGNSSMYMQRPRTFSARRTPNPLWLYYSTAPAYSSKKKKFLPFKSKYDGMSDEGPSRQSLARSLFGSKFQNTLPLSCDSGELSSHCTSKNRACARCAISDVKCRGLNCGCLSAGTLRNAEHDGTVIISTHAGFADREVAIGPDDKRGNVYVRDLANNKKNRNAAKNNGWVFHDNGATHLNPVKLYELLKPLFSDDHTTPVTEVIFLACNSGTTVSDVASEVAYAALFAAAVLEDTGRSITVRAPRGFVTRGYGQLSIQNTLGDDLARRCGGKTVYYDKPPKPIMEQFDTMLADPMTFSTFTTSEDGVTGPFLDWGDMYTSVPQPITHKTSDCDNIGNDEKGNAAWKTSKKYKTLPKEKTMTKPVGSFTIVA